MMITRNQRGFTLLEVVVAITILALMALMLARVFNQSARAVERGETRIALDEAARATLDEIERDLCQALVRSNVAFRVARLGDDADSDLYFVTTGARRRLETLRRDTAPLRLFPRETERWNKELLAEAPDGSTSTSASNIRHLRRHSDYYFHDENPNERPFETATETPRQSLRTEEHELTPPVSGLEAVAARVTSFSIVVNGDPDWRETTRPEDRPRYVDVAIGLAPASTLELARELFRAANPIAGLEIIAENEIVYARRVRLINQGVEALDLQP